MATAARNRPRPRLWGRVASFESAIVRPSMNRGLETSCNTEVEDDDENEDDYESPTRRLLSLLTQRSADHPFAILSGRDTHHTNKRATKGVGVGEPALAGDLFGNGVSRL